MSDYGWKIVAGLMFAAAFACFATAIIGPILWPDLGAKTTVTVIPAGCYQ